MNLLRNNVFAWIALVLGLFLLPGRVTGPNGDGMPGDLGDTRFNNYILEHGHQYLTGVVESFWSAPFMYPEERVISYADNLIGVFPLYSLFRFAGFDRESSLQGWFWLVCALNFLSSWWVMKKLTGHSVAAALGAYIFAFGLPVVSQINHLQLLPRFFIPVAVYGLIRFFDARDTRFFALMLGALLLQFYGSMYLGFLLFFCLFLAGFCLVIIKKIRWREILYADRKEIYRIAGSLLVFGLFIWPLYSEYSERSVQIGWRSWDEISPLLPSIRSWLYPGQDSLLWGFLSFNANHLKFPWEHVLFPGLMAVMAVLFLSVQLFRKKLTHSSREMVVVFLLVIAVAGILFLNVGGVSFYMILKKLVPGFGSMRAPSRIILVLLFFVGMMVAFGVKEVWMKAGDSLKRILPFVFLLMVITDHFVTYGGLIRHSKAESQERVQLLTDRLMRAERGPYTAFAYFGQPGDTANLLQLDAMMAAQSSGWKTVNGYSSSSPTGYTPFWAHHNDSTLREWLKFKGCKDSILVHY